MERVTEAALRRQRTIQTTLLFVILATLPCYCLGGVLLLTSPTRTNTVHTPTVSGITTATLAGEPSQTPYPSITPFQVPTIGPSATTEQLLPTPSQIHLFPTLPPTLTPIVFPPTRTPIVLPSVTPIIILPPTITLRPTSTPFVPPTSTPFIPPTLTRTPTPSLTPIPGQPTPPSSRRPTPTP